jgi:hypothetical protein
MSNLQGQRGELGMTVTIKRKATGKVETYQLTSVVEGDDAVKAQRMVEEMKLARAEKHANILKEGDDGGDAQHGK